MKTDFIKFINSAIPEITLLFGLICACLFYIFFKFQSKEEPILVCDQNWFFNSFLLLTVFFYTIISFFQFLFNGVDSFFIFEGSIRVDSYMLLVRSIFSYLIFVIVYVYFFEITSGNKNDVRFTHSFELSILILLIILGMSTCLGANNFIVFYLGLELQSFCFFILLFLGSPSFENVKAGIIYFLSVLISSIFFLVGVSYLYWKFGTLQLNELFMLVYADILFSETTIIDTAFLLFTFLGLFVKVGLVPLQMWVPNVYAFGKLFPVSLIATVSKLFGFAIILRLLIITSSNLNSFIFLEFVALCSILQGVLGALTQKSIFPLLGYSAIAHMGYVFLVLGINTEDAYSYAVFYLIVYIFNILPIFIFFLAAKKVNLGNNTENFANHKFTSVDDFQDIRLVGWKKVIAFLFFSTFFFSFIGIPPFSGFFAKFFVIKYLILTGHYFSAFLMGFLSVVSAFYYLKIVKSIFFSNNFSKISDLRSRVDDDSSKVEGPYWDVSNFTLALIIFFGLINILFIFFSPYLLAMISLLF